MKLKENYVIINNTRNLDLYGNKYIENNFISKFKEEANFINKTSQKYSSYILIRLNCFFIIYV